ncbi:hypothetical protein LshimejAT787_1000530 [Lyophyllum shimeji]|uniref:F-box domain-containing protein n=1 Tax=Lyophyllum shimeji TaxID=47721 RepID=A0A9P3UQ92_LYOSH|nr:hypothetical protein LshimejAT787_1000530 [Lyophyllum shimeji]
MASAVPHLPQEIINLVIQELSDDRTTLKACSAVSSSFREPAQAILFYSITISFPSRDNKRNGELLAILTAHPGIGSYVRWLGLYLEDSFTAGFFASLLRRFSNVGGLRLISVYPLQKDWAILSGPFKAALLQLLCLPSLTRLDLDYPDFPFPYLRFCSRLKHLVIHQCVYDNRLQLEDTPEPALVPLLSAAGWPNTDGAQQGFLESLDMGTWYALRQVLAAVQHPSSMLSLACLKTFVGKILEERDIIEIQNCLALSAPSLRKLSLHVSLSESLQRYPTIPKHSPRCSRLLHKLCRRHFFGLMLIFRLLSGRWASLYPMLSLQPLAALQFLHFSFCLDVVLAAHASTWVCGLLETIPMHNVLSTIVITAPVLFNVDIVDWGRIDFLSSRECHRTTLRCVCIAVAERMEPLVLERMPHLSEKNMIQFLGRGDGEVVGRMLSGLK